MTGRKTDFVIVGGGLAGGLIALALRRARPDLSVVLVEAGDTLGGNHRWSWFASDLSPAGEALLGGFRRSEWDRGYDVCFPGHARRLNTPYRSLASADFDAGLRRKLPAETIRQGAVTKLSERGVTLASGEELAARAVIDCRGPVSAPQLQGGWQVFMGRHLRTHRAHGIERPTIMDARVVQLEGYRFVYVLPLSAHEIFVEDTYYQDSPNMDRRALSARIDAFCAEQGWDGDPLTHETGVLPVITGGDFASFQAAQRVPGVALAGARGGFVHPLTSYTLPFAVSTALAIAADADLPGSQLAAMLEARARAHWRATGFYRRLGAMLFGAARPAERYRVFERFYRLPESLIERFYAGRSTRLDQARILCGKPPVSIGGALAALAGRRPAAPLEQAA
jgi:lycopene beta-cyclase